MSVQTDLNAEIIPCSPNQLIEVLTDHAHEGESVGVLGMPGQGKSEIIAQVAASVGKPMLSPHNLVLMDSSDLKGLPSFNTTVRGQSDEHVSMSWVQDKMWLQYAQAPLTCFLDELANAATMTIASAASIILEKRLDTLRFHPDTWVVWASNRTTDKAASNRIPTHVLNRSYIYELQSTVDDWSMYELNQTKAATDHLTVRFVRMKGDEAFGFDPARLINATPRSWSIVARKLAKQPSTPFISIAGRLGTGLATELMAFRKLAPMLPAKEQIMFDPKGAPVPNDPSALFLVTDMLADFATTNNLDTIRIYMERLPADFQAKLIHSATRRDKTLFMTRAFSEWGCRFAEHLV
jgi:hypothetical protein